MLLEKADALGKRIAEYRKLKEQAHHAQAFETRAQQLQKSASGLAAAVATMKALDAAGVTVAFKMSSKDQTRSRTMQLQEGFASDPAYIDDPGFDLRFEYTVPLSGLTEGVKTAGLTAWQAHVAARREKVPTDILNALRAVAEYRSIVATVKRCQEQIENLARTLPADVAAAERELTDLAEQQRAAWQKLTGGELPDSVILFLRASMGDGAELRLLSPEVLEWLKSRSLDTAFRIKPRQAS